MQSGNFGLVFSLFDSFTRKYHSAIVRFEAGAFIYSHTVLMLHWNVLLGMKNKSTLKWKWCINILRDEKLNCPCAYFACTVLGWKYDKLEITRHFNFLNEKRVKVINNKRNCCFPTIIYDIACRFTPGLMVFRLFWCFCIIIHCVLASTTTDLGLNIKREFWCFGELLLLTSQKWAKWKHRHRLGQSSWWWLIPLTGSFL